MSALVVQMVTGAQNNTAGAGRAPGAGAGPDGRHLRVGMCCKHFAVYDLEGEGIAQPNGTVSRKMFDARVNNRDMWESYMPAFRACAVTARASHVMCSYNSLNGRPTCGDRGLLTEILREQWAFQGFVVSGCDACSLTAL
jgi:beta-glucosidase-like glycosyl hydrolase